METAKTFDASLYLNDQDAMIAYLNAALDEGDPLLLQAVLGDIAKARGMTALAREIGVSREALYKSLSDKGNPSFRTIQKVITALGGQLQIVAR